MWSVMNDLKRCLAAVGVGVCCLLPWLGVLYILLGEAALFWFLCTWMFVVFFGFLFGLLVLPDANPAS